MTNPWVLVTGGAHRLGRRLCLGFARAGWDVICHFNESVEAAYETCTLVERMGRNAHAIRADLSDSEQREGLFKSASQLSQGHLMACVNSASVFEPDMGLDFSPSVLRGQLEVNLVAPLHLGSLLAQHALPDTGRAAPVVIHVIDQKVENLNPDYFSYTVSKLALERAVRLQAQALAPRVRVVGISPGLMFASGPQTAENFETARSVNLLRRPIDPEDVVKTAVFMAETAALTGVTLCVDNGQHLVPTESDVMFVVDQIERGRHGRP
jgi:NAD(P)-dependent dehydrogenase (short-subunit alcohol dehydrogenase family)